MALIETLGTDTVLFAFWSAIAFIVGYTALAPWWRSAIGWARVSLDFGIALALSPTLIHLLFGIRVEDDIVFAWYQIGAICFVGLVSLWNLVLVIRLQVSGHWGNILKCWRDIVRNAVVRDAGSAGRRRTRRRNSSL